MYKRIIRILLIITILVSLVLLFIDNYVESIGKQYVKEIDKLKKADAIIVLGAYVHPNGYPSNMLEDRLKVGLDIYKSGYSDRFLLSGDHGRIGYDEVNNMRKYIEKKGIEKDIIFMDHAGFNTYDSLYRAKEIFQVEKAIIITQEYHLHRALYIAESLGIEAQGVSADLREYPGMFKYRTRDVLSRFKAFLYVNTNAKPKFLGEIIPIKGSGLLTHDIIEE